MMHLFHRKNLTKILASLGITLLFSHLIWLAEVLRSPSPFHWPTLQKAYVMLLIYMMTVIIIANICFGLLFRGRLPVRLNWGVIWRALTGFLITGILTTWLGGLLINRCYPGEDMLTWRQFMMFCFYNLLFGLPMFLYFFVRDLWQRALEKVKEKDLAQERLARELLLAKLKALQAQTNPHFLFNTLNSIAALIAVDPARAETVVEKLAGLFRYTLDSHQQTQAALADEVQIVADYLTIEKVRFGDRLTYDLDIDPDLGACPVPALILQPLVENAVRHGIARREDGGRLTIQASPEPAGKIRLRVENEGPPPDARSADGVGLPNLHARCRMLYQEGYTFSLSQPEPGLTRAELIIPRSIAAAPAGES